MFVEKKELINNHFLRTRYNNNMVEIYESLEIQKETSNYNKHNCQIGFTLQYIIVKIVKSGSIDNIKCCKN